MLLLTGINLEPITPLDVRIHSEIQYIAHLEAKVILAPCQRYGRRISSLAKMTLGSKLGIQHKVQAL